ncbi:MAG: 30S ribosomal protein S4 [Candidatus Paceibacterota bacterium]
MKIGPKFKIAKRLGAPIFEKTQTQKFALSQARGGRQVRRGGQMSDYKRQLIEKQKMRFSYGITEKQLRRFVDEAIKAGHQPITSLMERLESRLDNTIYRLGLTKTRQQARQVVAHGHILVNGKKLSIPSHKVKSGDVISVREGSKTSALFNLLADTHEGAAVPAWLTLDIKKLSANVVGVPVYNPTETLFDPELVMEYYSR